jgi:hypothetical protein
MAKRLLDRQASLLDYLTSGEAIFAAAADVPLPRPLRGIDSRLLRLEARFSYEKRMEKIISVFPRTFALLGDGPPEIVQQFVRTCPPVDIGRLSNARQFHDFVAWRWRGEHPVPPYLKDIAACEFACAQVRLARVEGEKTAEREHGRAPTPGLRRRLDAVLLRCDYDIREIFEQGPQQASPPRRDTPLAVVMPMGEDQPRVFEILPVVFELLESLAEWTDPATLGLTAEHEPLILDLAEHGLIEVRR